MGKREKKAKKQAKAEKKARAKLTETAEERRRRCVPCLLPFARDVFH